MLSQVLERLKANQRRDYMKGTVSGSVQVDISLTLQKPNMPGKIGLYVRSCLRAKSTRVGFIKSTNAGNRSTDEGAARHLQESKFQIGRLSGVKKASALLLVVL